MHEVPACPLCEFASPNPIAEGAGRYFHCPSCDLRFLHPGNRLNADAEKARYMKHENEASNAGYRKFLEPLFQVLQPRLKPGMTGLDFGCGPGSVLREIFAAHGFDLAIYDPFFAPGAKVLSRRYDFVVASEVVEHFHHPRKEFSNLIRLLKPGGTLALMTLLVEPSVDFASWHYRRDPTHVVFYSRACFTWLARWAGFVDLDFHGERIVTLRRPGDT